MQGCYPGPIVDKYGNVVMFMLEDHDMVVRELNKDKDKVLIY